MVRSARSPGFETRLGRGFSFPDTFGGSRTFSLVSGMVSNRFRDESNLAGGNCQRPTVCPESGLFRPWVLKIWVVKANFCVGVISALVWASFQPISEVSRFGPGSFQPKYKETN